MPEIVEEFELVENAGGRRGDVDFFDGDITRLVMDRSWWVGGVFLERRGDPGCSSGRRVPVISMLVVQEVFGFVDGREGA